MGWFTDLLSGGKVAEDVAGTVRESAKSTFSIIDEAFHTEQEKSEARAKAMDTYVRLWESTTRENTGTAVARRKLMDKLTNFVLTACTICIYAELLGNSEAAKIIIENVKGFYIGEAFGAGTAFYFLTHVAKGIKGGGK